MSYSKKTKTQLAQRVGRDIRDGAYVNLGIGMPTLVASHLPVGVEIILHSENGILGMGPAPAAGDEDYDLINAGKQPVTLLPGGAYFHHADSFAMMRGGPSTSASWAPSRCPQAVTWRTGTRVKRGRFPRWAARWTWRSAPRRRG